MRECGDCTLCCLLLPIPEAKSEHSQLCSHCNKGCNIYDKRPNMCKEFNCDWLLDETIPEELRPDKCNVIFEYINKYSVLCLVHFNDLNAWNREPVMNYMKKLNSEGISVAISSYTSETNRFMLADGHTKEHIFNGAMDELKKIYK